MGKRTKKVSKKKPSDKLMKQYYLELADRTFIQSENWNDFVIKHTGMEFNDKLREKAEKIGKEIFELYQVMAGKL